VTAGFLELSGVTASLGGAAVLHGLDAGFRRGELVALAGPNGAGKSTLLRALAGLTPHGGAIRLDGRPLAAMARGERARLIGYLPQGHQTHWPLPVRDIVALGRFPHGATDRRCMTAVDIEAVETAMRQTGVAGVADRAATRLSGGERARVALARVLALGAPTILADEPTASLDPRYQLDVMALLKRIAGAGALVIAATHDLSHAAHFSDRVMVLERGRIAAFGPPREALDVGVLERVFKVRAIREAGGDDRLVAPWESLP
jgi:iron complex transport system ATP-binding protein